MSRASRDFLVREYGLHVVELVKGEERVLVICTVATRNCPA